MILDLRAEYSETAELLKAQSIAQRLDINVLVHFDGFTIRVYPGSKTRTLLLELHKKQTGGKK